MAATFENTFSWSVSRDAAFRECPRKYYFNYYGHWGGWLAGAPERTREIYILKRLKNRSTWAGQTVHECVARSLRNLSRGVPVLPLDEILAITRNLMRQDYRNSIAGRYRRDPSLCGLFEHEYAVDVTDEAWRNTADGVDQCLRTFYGSEHYHALSQTPPADFLEVEEFSSFLLDAVELKIKLDCATREKERVVVWDWKTGKREPDMGLSIQMGCYALYAREKYGAELENVATRQFDLTHGVLREHRPTERSLEEIAAYIRGSIADMTAMLENPAANTAEEERFAKVARRSLCARCSFFKVCRPDL